MSEETPETTGAGPSDASDEEIIDKAVEEPEEEVSDESESDETEEETEETEPEKDEDLEKTLKEIEEEDEDKEPDLRIGRPSFSEVKKEFPELFKKFPALKEAIFREDAYSKVFPTVESAKEAERKANVIDFMDQKLGVEGDPEPLIKALPDGAIGNIAKKILPALYERNPNLYREAVIPAFRSALQETHRRAVESGNINLEHAVEHLSQHFFKNPDINADLPGERVDPKLVEERTRFQNERSQNFYRQGDEFFKGVQDTTYKLVLRELEKTFDPDKVLSPVVRDSLIERVIKDTDELVKQDERYAKLVNTLRMETFKTGFTKEAKTRIIAAYLGAFKPRVGPVRAKYRAEALGKKTDNSNQRQSSEKKFIPKNPGVEGKAPSKYSPIPKDTKLIDYSRTTDDDIINGRAVLKR